MAVAFIASHLVTFIITFDFWGHGDGYLIAISAGQIVCAVYTLLLTQLPNGEILRGIYLIWYGFLAIFFAEIGLMISVIISGLYGIQIADQITLYRISEDIVAAATIDGIPFILLLMLTICVYNTRFYEVYGQYRDFTTTMDPYPWSDTDGNPPSSDLNTIMLANDHLIKSFMQDPIETRPLQQQRP